MEKRFDALAESLAGGVSRRGALRLILGGLAGALFAPSAWAASGKKGCQALCHDELGLRGTQLAQCKKVCRSCQSASLLCSSPAAGFFCCSPGTVCLAGACCPSGQVCGSTCCPSGQTCVAGACCPNGQVCGSTCCPSGTTCVGGHCLAGVCGSPATCGGFTRCSQTNPDCLCFTLADAPGSGFCSPGSTPCSGLQPCKTTADCPPGHGCTFSCCSSTQAFCLPPCGSAAPPAAPGGKTVSGR